MKKARKIDTITYNAAKEYKGTIYDPTMLQINLLLKHSSLTTRAIANKCGVSQPCINNWIAQRTKRPQALTMKFVLRALGYDLKVVPSAGHNRGPSDDEAA